MAITFECGHCGKSLTTSDDKAGRKAKCPGCGEVVTVPEPDDAGDLDADDYDDDQDGVIQPVRQRSVTQTCPMCGAKNSVRARACQACGEELDAEEDPRRRRRDDYELEYAGFWLRLGAFVIDQLLLGFVGLMLGCCFGFVLAFTLVAARNGDPNAFNDPSMRLMINLFSLGLSITINGLYRVIMESSSKQATLGKIAVGIEVCDLDGRRISFLHALGRYGGFLLSCFTCGIGFILAGFTERKQALHDILAGTLVVRK